MILLQLFQLQKGQFRSFKIFQTIKLILKILPNKNGMSYCIIDTKTKLEINKTYI